MKKFLSCMLAAVLMCLMLVPAASAEYEYAEVPLESVYDLLYGEWKPVNGILDGYFAIDPSNLYICTYIFRDDLTVDIIAKDCELFGAEYAGKCNYNIRVEEVVGKTGIYVLNFEDPETHEAVYPHALPVVFDAENQTIHYTIASFEFVFSKDYICTKE